MVFRGKLPVGKKQFNGSVVLLAAANRVGKGKHQRLRELRSEMGRPGVQSYTVL